MHYNLAIPPAETRLNGLHEVYRSTDYFAPKAKFILSINAPNKLSLDIFEDIKNAWDPLWQKKINILRLRFKGPSGNSYPTKFFTYGKGNFDLKHRWIKLKPIRYI